MQKYLIFTILLFNCNYAYAATLQAGDLLISEVMSNPSAVSDANGEWFEIYNASANAIDLNGLIIRDNGSNSHIVNNGLSLLITPGEYFVLGRNSDTSTNGGLVLDYLYSDFTLSNSSDQIILLSGTTEIASLDYNGAPFGASGISAEIINQNSITTEMDYQLTEFTQYGNGDFGTPGSAGSFELMGATPVPIPGAIWLFASAAIFGLRAVKPSILSN